jgi:hypothetical protein
MTFKARELAKADTASSFILTKTTSFSSSLKKQGF